MSKDERVAIRTIAEIISAFNFDEEGEFTEELSIKRVPKYSAVELAHQEIVRRSMRSARLSPELFGEPAWNILLDLFVHTDRLRRVSVTEACIASGAPPTTGLRWLNLLIEKGLVVREESTADNRVTFVSLSDEAKKILTEYFLASGSLR